MKLDDLAILASKKGIPISHHLTALGEQVAATLGSFYLAAD